MEIRIHVANIRDRLGRKANLTDILLKFERMNDGLSDNKRKQTIVYFNGRNKAIDAARRFSDALGDNGIKNDPQFLRRLRRISVRKFTAIISLQK
jgi:hypothetical protein